MSEEHLIRNCAPTLAGLKTASMFTCPYESRESLLSSLRHWNRMFRKKGLLLLPLRFSQDKVLVYLFRPKKLSCDLSESGAAELLRRFGYDPEDPNGCIRTLRRKISSQKDFPHEVGLFLGYPLEDVCGFMENRPCSCKCTGCWRVYGDVEAARKKFAQYKKCTRIYHDLWSRGVDFERLTVSS